MFSIASHRFRKTWFASFSLSSALILIRCLRYWVSTVPKKFLYSWSRRFTYGCVCSFCWRSRERASSGTSSFRRLLILPSTGSKRLCSIFSYTEESLWSIVITRDGTIPKSFKAAIYSVVVGQPSRIQPFVRQSGFSSLVLTKLIMKSFGNGLQDSKIERYSDARALSLSFLMKSLMRWDTLTYWTLNFSARF